jgi:hypothetical protein
VFNAPLLGGINVLGNRGTVDFAGGTEKIRCFTNIGQGCGQEDSADNVAERRDSVHSNRNQGYKAPEMGMSLNQPNHSVYHDLWQAIDMYASYCAWKRKSLLPKFFDEHITAILEWFDVREKLEGTTVSFPSSSSAAANCTALQC